MTFSRRGGVRVGAMGGAWPLALIRVSPGKIELSGWGVHTFAPGEVDVVEPLRETFFLKQAIRIHHTNPKCPEYVMFYLRTGRPALLEAIAAAGFRVGHPGPQVDRGFPVRWSALAGAILLWNFLLLLDYQSDGKDSNDPGPYAIWALLIAFLLATFLPRSQQLQKLFMREDRDVGEISGVLRFFQLISGIGLLALGASYLET